jgi:hypothetical protein
MSHIGPPHGNITIVERSLQALSSLFRPGSSTEFTKTYADRIASTEDFKVIVEKYMNQDMDLGANHRMDWFFDQFG